MALIEGSDRETAQPQINTIARVPGVEMSENELAATVQAKIINSVGYSGGKLSYIRMDADRLYRGDKFGNEVKGRSQVVSRDVAEAIDSMMPALMKIFTSSGNIVRYEPQGKEAPEGAPPQQTLLMVEQADEQAKQATDYCNWIVMRQNSGFQILYTWFKAALMYKNGIVKTWWDEAETIYKEHYKGLTDQEFDALIQDDEVSLESDSSYPDPNAPPPVVPPSVPGQPQPPVPPAPLLHDVVVKRTNKSGQVKIAAVPEDEFLIDRRAVSLTETPFCAHRFKTTVTRLKELVPGKDDVIDNLPSDEEAEFSQERLERFKDEDELPYRSDNPADPSMRELWCTEAYIKVDFDGDGFAEMRKVTCAGEGSLTILDNVEFDGQPFSAITPTPFPHKFFGNSVTDQTSDIQLIKSTLIRGSLDTMYNSISPQVGIVEGQVNLDDLLNRRPGGVVRMKSANALIPIVNPGPPPESFQMVEYLDTVREQRTGVTRYNQGLDADTLNKTAKGIGMIQQAGNERLELIARVFAETGVKDLFKRVLELVCKHQQRARIIKLRGKFVAMNPREWTEQMDVESNVGIGTGSRENQMQLMSMLLNLDREIVALQGGVEGPVVTAENIYRKLEKIVEFGGLPSVAPYYTDPSSAPQQAQQAQGQHKPDPKAQAAQAQLQLDQAKAQADQQHDANELAMKERIAQQELQMKERLGIYELILKSRQIGMEEQATRFEGMLGVRKQLTDETFRAHDMLHQQAQDARQIPQPAV